MLIIKISIDNYIFITFVFHISVGLTIVYKRRNSRHLDIQAVAATITELEPFPSTFNDEKSTDSKGISTAISTGLPKFASNNDKIDKNEKEGGNGSVGKMGKHYSNDGLNRKILNLMRFEDIHEWLAPTGNVDAITAFGGKLICIYIHLDI